MRITCGRHDENVFFIVEHGNDAGNVKPGKIAEAEIASSSARGLPPNLFCSELLGKRSSVRDGEQDIPSFRMEVCLGWQFTLAFSVLANVKSRSRKIAVMTLARINW